MARRPGLRGGGGGGGAVRPGPTNEREPIFVPKIKEKNLKKKESRIEIDDEIVRKRERGRERTWALLFVA